MKIRCTAPGCGKAISNDIDLPIESNIRPGTIILCQVHSRQFEMLIKEITRDLPAKVGTLSSLIAEPS